jgi:hypothetical protein
MSILIKHIFAQLFLVVVREPRACVHHYDVWTRSINHADNQSVEMIFDSKFTTNQVFLKGENGKKTVLLGVQRWCMMVKGNSHLRLPGIRCISAFRDAM